MTLDVPFTDLSKVPDSNISVIRMRPLLWIGKKILTINGRVDFHLGWSENPTVGTFEDWVIPNSLWFPHPIHVHLINFQVVKEYDLQRLMTNLESKDLSQDCTIYELDFLLNAILDAVNASRGSPNKNLSEIYKNVYPGEPFLGFINYYYLCVNRFDIGN